MSENNEITKETIWEDWDTFYWKPGLSLPALPWVRPFLAIMGLPKKLIKQPQVWEQIYNQLIQDYEELMKPFVMWEGDEYTLAERKVVQQVITKSLTQLANQLGKETAVELERWTRRHFLDSEFKSAMFHWPLLLRRGSQYYYDENPIAPPSCLEPLLPEIEEIIYYGINGSEYIMKYMMTLPTEEVPIEEELEITWDWQAIEVKSVIIQELTMRILNKIAQTLNEQELAEFLNWAVLFKTEEMSSEPKYLRGDKYLKPQPVYADFPSVLDFVS
ncbi:MAG TPA: hypothetical protein VK184_25105 [Nostocaceae cyanobacterium]|nr:hypothetical protein [Nostocaceae cyanobacterium]